MKARLNKFIALVAAAVVISFGIPKYAMAQTYDDQQDEAYNDQGADVEEQQDVDFNTFYDALSPYGTWENDPEYGQVWVSNEADFTPYYSNGNWAYSNTGWTWVSSYNWGWAPFHYGRWAYRNHWVWVPGYQWAPAWVNWRTGGDYYGWAPLGPGMSIGVNVGFGFNIAAERWNFCPRNYITSGNFRNYCVDRRRNVTIIRNTTVINNIHTYRNARFVAGPNRREVERYTHTRIQTMHISNSRRPGATVINRNRIQMYRPNVRAGNTARLQNRRIQQNRQQQLRQQPNRPADRRTQQPAFNQQRRVQRNNDAVNRQQDVRNRAQVQQNRQRVVADNRVAFNSRQPQVRNRAEIQQRQPVIQQRQFNQQQERINRPQPQERQQFTRPQPQRQQQREIRQPQPNRQQPQQQRPDNGRSRDRRA